jgi:hypothetical protein
MRYKRNEMEGRAIRVFATPNPDGQREFYWITTPEYDHTEEELSALVDTQEWHGPFESEQEAFKDAQRVADENEATYVPDTVKLSFQADKSAAGLYVFHAVSDGRTKPQPCNLLQATSPSGCHVSWPMLP